MTRQDGFAVMDVSTGIVNDPKFRKLQRLHPELVATGFTAYLSVMGESWRAGRRVSIEDAWPTILPFDPAVPAALTAVGLLDRRGYLPVKPWDGWFGPAAKRRQANRDRWERYNAQRTAASTNSDAQPTALPRGNHVATATSVPTVPTVPTVRSSRQSAGEERAQSANGGPTKVAAILPSYEEFVATGKGKAS